jgi:uncharacterized protein (TIGR03435 family)
MSRWRIWAGIGIGLVSTGMCAAQVKPAATPSPRYDAVSIHPNKSGTGSMSINIDDGNFVAENVTLTQLLYDAYQIRSALTTGLPSWADSAHFDIRAKALDADPAALKHLTEKQESALVVGLLEDRFTFKAHLQTKTMPVYDLVVEKDGPKFKPHVFPAGADETGGGGMTTYNNRMTGEAMPMSSFCLMLAAQVERTVVDKTGLAGHYDVTLKWTPERDLAAPDNGLPDASPPIYKALEEQLGLKLVPAKGPVETLVIDHVELPDGN